MADVNSMYNQDHIYAGQRLRLPHQIGAE